MTMGNYKQYVRVYLAKINDLPDPKEKPEILERLSKERREKALRPVLAEDRKRQLGAGLLLKKILREYGVKDVEIFTGLYGKPHTEYVKFNLSHSGDLVAVAVAQGGEIGCDIEKIREIPQTVLSKLTQDEREYIENASDGEKSAAFFDVWTKRESFLKMTGEGLSGFQKIELKGDDILYEGEKVECAFRKFELEGYALCVCTLEEADVELVGFVELR